MNELPSELGTPLVSLDTPVVSKVVKNRFARVEQEDRGRLWLTPRDEALLTDLFLHQAMSRGQLQALHFGSTARCNARLRKLFDHGYVVRDFHPMAPYGTQGIYRIGPRAAKIVAQRLDADANYVKQLCRGTKRIEFLEHTLEIVDFYLKVREGIGQTPGYSLESWMPEIQVRHEYELQLPGGGARRQVFKPDAFLRFGVKGELHSCFIEIDRGNASANVFGQKVPHYQQYKATGLFQEMYQSSDFTVLVVTTGEKRLAHLCELVQQQGCSYFWFTTRSQLQEIGPLASTWTAPSGNKKFGI